MVSPTTDRRQGLVGNTAIKAPVTVLAAANITLSGQQTIDGVALLEVNAAGVADRVLCIGQTDSTKNGIWDVSTGLWTRSVDANGNYDLAKGTLVEVTGGTLYAGSFWNVTAANPITIGTTALTWARSLSSSLTTLSFQQAGAGAVLRDAQSKMRDIVSLKDAGALEDNATDDTAAWNKAIGWMNAGTGRAVMKGGISLVFGALNPLTADGFAIYAPAPSESFRVQQQTDNVTTFTIKPADPSVGRINGFGLHNFTVWNASASPTGGTAIKVIRGGRARVSNIDVRNFYKGISFEGGADQKWNNITVAGPSGWVALAANSYCASFEVASYGAVNEVPSEVFFIGGNMKGSGGIYLESALNIKAGDGLWFDNMHMGFAYTQSCLLSPSGTSTYIDSIKFTSCYFDGNFNTTGSGVVIAGSAAGATTNIDFIACSVKLHGKHGYQMTGTGTMRGIRINGGMVEANGRWGVLIGAQSDVSVIGVDFYNNNTANVAANVIDVTGAAGVRIHGCSFRSLTYTHPVGVNVDVTSADVDVLDCKFGAITTPMILLSPTSNYGKNQLIGGLPTVAASAALALPYGFDSVIVTGNTAVTSITGPNIAGHRVRLRMTGTPTITRGGNIGLSTAGGNMVCTAGSMLDLENDGTVWREVSRVVA